LSFTNPFMSGAQSYRPLSAPTRWGDWFRMRCYRTHDEFRYRDPFAQKRGADDGFTTGDDVFPHGIENDHPRRFPASWTTSGPLP
jgi:hypothetical protein